MPEAVQDNIANDMDQSLQNDVLSRKFGTPTSAQLEKINKMAKRPLTKEEIFVYSHKMAGDMIIPNRYMQLTKPLLNVFREDANKGVSFLLGHSWTLFSPKPALAYGKVFEGWVGKQGLVEGESVSFNGSAYIVRGQEKDGIKTDSIISDIETGIIFDTSIGWGANTFICSICGNDIRDYGKCHHYPGKEYVIDEDTGETKLCYIMAKPPGYLMEDSAVFDGAYPSAGSALSAIVDEGGFESREGEFFVVDDFKKMPIGELVFGVYSSRGGIVTFTKKITSGKAHSLSTGSNEKLEGKDGDNMNEEVRKFIKELGLDIGDVDEIAAETVLEKLKVKWNEEANQGAGEGQAGEETNNVEFEALPKDEVKKVLGKEYDADEILKFAKEGLELRNELIKDTIEWGVRAQANDFDKTTWEELLYESNRSLESIRKFRDQFKKQAENDLSTGKVTRFNSGQDSNKNEIPDDYFKA